MVQYHEYTLAESGSPSHINIPGNEIADFLAKRSCSEIAITDYALTYREIYFLKKIKDKQVWIAPPDHPGISRKSPGDALEFDRDRNDQTAVSRFAQWTFEMKDLRIWP
ncbi:hypothetical protein TNCV_712321 [Trichonephila clavipes]|nr:hypothetical protein TNCV_712321 [Trichonephila clavipes]